MLTQLLEAFKQDTRNPLYPDRAALLDYCSRSANPIGRLLLYLAGTDDADALAQSDALCSALQLINFWQDMSRDHPRGRIYVPLADAQRHGLDVTACAPTAMRRAHSCANCALVAPADARRRAAGAPLPGRFGWELRLVVQGGLRILDKIEGHGFNALRHRPTVGALDAPLLLWRALWMRRASPTLLSGPAAR